MVKLPVNASNQANRRCIDFRSDFPTLFGKVAKQAL